MRSLHDQEHEEKVSTMARKQTFLQLRRKSWPKEPCSVRRHLHPQGLLTVEQFTGGKLEGIPAITRVLTNPFDPKRHVTGAGLRSACWRTNFSGIGTPRYCATVERTEQIAVALTEDLRSRVNEFLGSLNAGILDRTLQWAYRSEAQDSFAIEREAPGEDQAHSVVRLLQQAHDRRPLTEDYLDTSSWSDLPTLNRDALQKIPVRRAICP